VRHFPLFFIKFDLLLPCRFNNISYESLLSTQLPTRYSAHLEWFGIMEPPLCWVDLLAEQYRNGAPVVDDIRGDLKTLSHQAVGLPHKSADVS
jgi:hypothetical protein